MRKQAERTRRAALEPVEWILKSLVRECLAFWALLRELMRSFLIGTQEVFRPSWVVRVKKILAPLRDRQLNRYVVGGYSDHRCLV